MSAPTDIPVFPMARDTGCPFDPPPQLRRADRIARVRIWDGSEPWLITGYDDVRALLADPRVSADATKTGYPISTVALRAAVQRSRPFMSMDDPEHADYRRLLTGHFSVKRIERMRPWIQQTADRLLDEMLAQGNRSADLVSAFALPLPSLVICELLGVPYTERDRFHRLAGTSISTVTSAEEAGAAAEELLGLIRAVVVEKQRGPGDDILSHLAASGRLSVEEITGIGKILLMAGHETSANMIALGTALLLANPEQAAVLRDCDDPAIVESAVEELLRFLTVVHHGRRRVAVADIEVGGVRIEAGEGLILAIETANRDSQAFPGDPDVVDVRRNARNHLAFAFGPHQCLGQTLARMELQVAYGTLFRRVPTLALAAPVDDLPFKHDMRIYGLHALPVTW
ncbi:cytochrome P450 [Nocardia yamanashiensis]|uniref:cytochrome P450 n=1 Tax=Nocardia yamanashiensis TaxID=209247 RepID=UPI000833762F|nr:cytochrome P450 [Nocardia yamanashiensis]